jgi:hypothetical protein
MKPMTDEQLAVADHEDLVVEIRHLREVIFERDKALGDIGTENGRLRKVVDTGKKMRIYMLLENTGESEIADEWDEALRELDEVAK